MFCIIISFRFCRFVCAINTFQTLGANRKKKTFFQCILFCAFKIFPTVCAIRKNILFFCAFNVFQTPCAIRKKNLFFKKKNAQLINSIANSQNAKKKTRAQKKHGQSSKDFQSLKVVPIDSSQRKLSIGTSVMFWGSLSRKLWRK